MKLWMVFSGPGETRAQAAAVCRQEGFTVDLRVDHGHGLPDATDVEFALANPGQTRGMADPTVTWITAEGDVVDGDLEGPSRCAVRLEALRWNLRRHRHTIPMPAHQETASGLQVVPDPRIDRIEAALRAKGITI